MRECPAPGNKYAVAVTDRTRRRGQVVAAAATARLVTGAHSQVVRATLAIFNLAGIFAGGQCSGHFPTLKKNNE